MKGIRLFPPRVTEAWGFTVTMKFRELVSCGSPVAFITGEIIDWFVYMDTHAYERWYELNNAASTCLCLY